MTLRTYEITLNGEAGPAIVAAFEDFEVIIGRGHTTLRGERMDQPALYGAMDRLQDLGLELLHVTTVGSPLVLHDTTGRLHSPGVSPESGGPDGSTCSPGGG